MVQFKKELLKNGSCIKCYSEFEAEEVVAWYHANGIRWRTTNRVDETFWSETENNCIYYKVKISRLLALRGLYALPHVTYYDALLSIDNTSSIIWYDEPFYERIEKMIDEKLKDYQKIEPEPEPEFKVGDRVRWFYGSDIGHGVIHEIKNNRFLVEYFFQKMRWFQKDNLIKIGHEE